MTHLYIALSYFRLLNGAEFVLGIIINMTSYIMHYFQQCFEITTMTLFMLQYSRFSFTQKFVCIVKTELLKKLVIESEFQE